jgi:hypothetical protein
MNACAARLLILAALSAACSSYNRAQPVADAGATTDAPGDAPALALDGAQEGYSCERLCRRLRSVAACAAAVSGCSTMCEVDVRGFPASCASAFDALFACVEGTPASRISCGAMAYPYLDCMAAYGAATTCARGAR